MYYMFTLYIYVVIIMIYLFNDMQDCRTIADIKKVALFPTDKHRYCG